MEQWQISKARLLSEIAVASDKFLVSLAAEIDENGQDLVQSLREKISILTTRNTDLAEELQAFRIREEARLQEITSQSAGVESSATPQGPRGHIIADLQSRLKKEQLEKECMHEKYSHLEESYNELGMKYMTLQENWKHLNDARSKLEVRARHYKSSSEHWRKEALRIHGQQDGPILGRPAFGELGEMSNTEPRDRPNPILPVLPDDTETSSPAADLGNNTNKNTPLRLENGLASGSTNIFNILEPTEQVPVKPDPQHSDSGMETTFEHLKSEDAGSSNDLPVFVSERCIRKPKRKVTAKASSRVPNVRIKEENIITSSPIGLATISALSDSMDLDEIGEKVYTPRKRNNFALEIPVVTLPSASLNTQLHEARIGQNPSLGDQNTLLAQSNSAIASLSPSKPEFGLFHNRFAKRRRLAGATGQSTNTERSSATRELQSGLERPEAHDTLPNQRRSPTKVSRSFPPSEILKSHFTPNRTPLQTISKNFTESARKIDCLSNKSAPNTNQKPSEKSSKAVPRGSISSGRKRLRNLPVSELNLDHFKINPEHNSGFEYAFTDVVRNRDERRCLAGCTKAGCCGPKFRALAEGLQIPTERQTPRQREEDQKLLERFLGDNKHKLSIMADEEKEEMLLQAQTRELANKYGKHRHAYERRASPPGFWEADFPTTQEEAIVRQKAMEFERGLVEQRYAEAMRSGGAYLFRDE